MSDSPGTLHERNGVPRLDALTSLRFLAALAIVVHHSRGPFIPPQMIAGLPLDSGVSFFFVLSGFVLAYAYESMRSRSDISRFLIARVARVWPVHMASLIVCMVLGTSLAFGGILPAAANILMVHAWVPLGSYFFSGNAVSWSISTELGFYLLFPLLLVGTRRSPLAILAIGAFIAAGVVLLCGLFNLPPFSNQESGMTAFGILYVNPLARLFEFALGVSTSLVWQRHRQQLGSNFLAWTAAEALVIAGFLYYLTSGRGYVFFLAVHRSGIKDLLEWLQHGADLAIFFAALIFVMAMRAGAVAKLLAFRPFIFLGEISYSVYMLHFTCITLFDRNAFLAEASGPVRAAALLATIIAVSSAMYLIVERPARHAIRSIGTRHRTAVVSATLMSMFRSRGPSVFKSMGFLGAVPLRDVLGWTQAGGDGRGTVVGGRSQPVRRELGRCLLGGVGAAGPGHDTHGAVPRHHVADAAMSTPLSPRQNQILALFERIAPARAAWVERNAYFYAADHAYMRFLIPEGSSVLEIGCGDGQLLAALKPKRAVGIDLSPAMITAARARHPDFELHVGNAEDRSALATIAGPFDYIVVSDTIGLIEDCESFFRLLHRLTSPDTRLIVAYYSHLWEAFLKLAERLGQMMPQVEQNWLSTADIANLLALADYEIVRQEWRQLIPKRLLGIGPMVNRFIAPLPGIRRLCLRNYAVARPLQRMKAPETLPSVTVLVPCRNEKGNIESAVTRLPRFAPDMEILFVEGHSKDGTFEECARVKAAYPDRDIKVLRQDGKGKGDAVRKGFAAARGEALMILDADSTVPPETLPRFYDALVAGRGEFINGTRLVYPRQAGAMRPLNTVANRGFAILFSYLLNQRFTDTLCGTKVLWKRDYERIVANRAYFGDFDPFGDFDLIFGAAKLNLRIIEVPVRYADRTYGETQISRFTHGWLLARMVLFAWRKLKAF